MYNFRKCTIGVAPTRRDTFLNNCRDQIMERVRQLAKTYDVELVTIEGLARENLLIDNCDIEKIVRRFREKDVDAVFVPHANFGQEEAVAKLCKAMGKPVLLWGPRDPAPLGVVDQMQDRAYDVQCGLFATGKALLSYGIPFTYIENCWLDSPILERGFEDFVRSVCAAKAFRGARVGQLSVRPWQFLTVRCNENELLEKFGIEVTPIESSEIISAIGNTLQNRASDIRDTIVGWTQKADLSALGNDSLKKMAAAVLAIREIAEQNGCNVMAGECWKMLQQAYGISACFVWGALTDMGLPVTCETDVLGAIGSGVMFGATRIKI